MEKVLITGGAGFIGSHTVNLLLEDGIKVRVLDNFSSGRLEYLDESNPRLEIIEGDITDNASVKASMSGVSHCLHLAAQVSVIASLDDPVHSANQNILGFINMLNEAKRQGIKRLVYASSAAVYGIPANIPLTETDTLAPLSPYGLEKSVDEQYVEMFSRLYGISALGQRYFNVYGPRQDPRSPYAGVIALFVDKIARAHDVTVFGDGRQTRDFIYVEDVARANVTALGSDLTGSCNIGTGIRTNLLELIDIISDITGNRIDIGFEPGRDGDIRHSLADVTRMREELGITARYKIDQGLRALIDYSATTG